MLYSMRETRTKNYTSHTNINFIPTNVKHLRSFGMGCRVGWLISIISEDPTNQIRGHLFQDECSAMLTTVMNSNLLCGRTFCLAATLY